MPSERTRVTVVCAGCDIAFEVIPSRAARARYHDAACRAETRAIPPLVRLQAKIIIDVTTRCWLWTGTTANKGYGTLSVRQPDGGSRPVYVHRFMYETVHGPIPDELVIDHLCRVHNCCNPEHLEAVTPQTNSLRGIQRQVLIHNSGVCSQGHLMDESNSMRTMRTNGKPRLVCRTCHYARRRLWQAKKRQAHT
jgi:hypothetical protein